MADASTPRHNTISYVELGARNAADYAGTKTFYVTAFGWQYTDYGPDYADTHSSGKVGRATPRQRLAGAFKYLSNQPTASAK